MSAATTAPICFMNYTNEHLGEYGRDPCCPVANPCDTHRGYSDCKQCKTAVYIEEFWYSKGYCDDCIGDFPEAGDDEPEVSGWDSIMDEDGLPVTAEGNFFVSMCKAPHCILRPNGPISGYCLAHCLPFAFAVGPIKRLKSKIWKVRVRCPYCKEIHSHGGGNGETPQFGAKGSDCKNVALRRDYWVILNE